MKKHHFYYLTLVLAIVIGGFATYFFISQTLFPEGDFLLENKKIKADPAIDGPEIISREIPISKTEVSSSFIKGIDIANYQGDIDWTTLSEKVSFVICKATEGKTYQDVNFEENWMSIKNSGRIRGAYHFYRANDDPVAQANFFWNTVGELEKRDLPLVLDVESASLPGAIIKSNLNSDLLLFLRILEDRSGKKPVVYTNTSFANQYLTDAGFAEYPLWLAEYTSGNTPNIPNTWAQSGWVFWQRSDTYDLISVNKDVDFDVFNGSEEDLEDFIRSSSGQDR